MSACCYRRCKREVTQAFDVWSWFEELRRQTPKHYEVCDKHAKLFRGYTGARLDERTEKVRERCTPTDLTHDEIVELRRLALKRHGAVV